MGVEFIYLHERQHEVAKEEVVPCLTVATYAFEPMREGGIRVTGEANQHRDINALSEEPENEFNLFRVGFEVVARGIDATSEDFRAGLAPEALNTVV